MEPTLSFDYSYKKLKTSFESNFTGSKEKY